MAKVRAHWAAIGDSLTFGWGSTDPATKAYPVIAGLPRIGKPGQCLTIPGPWPALIDTFANEVNNLKADFGVNAIVVEIGLNDLRRRDKLYDDMLAGYQHLAKVGDNHHVKVVFSTITPWGAGSTTATALKQQNRAQLNHWVRTTVGFVEYAIPMGNATLRPEFDSGDHTHPSDAGHARMGGVLAAYAALHQEIKKP